MNIMCRLSKQFGKLKKIQDAKDAARWKRDHPHATICLKGIAEGKKYFNILLRSSIKVALQFIFFENS